MDAVIELTEMVLRCFDEAADVSPSPSSLEAVIVWGEHSMKVWVLRL